MLKLSFQNINENSSIVFQKSYLENKNVAFHTWKECYLITSRENWNYAFLAVQEKYFLSGLGTQSAKIIIYQVLKNQEQFFTLHVYVWINVNKHAKD